MSRDAQRNGQLVRLLQILRDLDRLGGVDLYELAERYGTTVRTIRRDLDALQAVGLPLVEESAGKRKRWRVEFQDHLTRLSELVDVSHYLALRVAMGPAHRASSLYAGLEDLSDKLEQALGPPARRTLQAIESCIFSYEKFAYQRAPPDVLWPLVTAIHERRLCAITYRAPRATPVDKRFEILPLRMFVHQGGLYLHAHVPKHDTVILLHLHRLKRLTVLERRGRPPSAYDPATWESTAFGVFSNGPITDYHLRFTRGVAPFIRERVWHPTQKLRERDGGVDLTFRCAESVEVTAWVASWHSAVTVLAPESLRQQLHRVGQSYVERYGGEAELRPLPAKRDRKVEKRRTAR